VKIALLCNERPARVPPGSPDDAFEEYDTPETLRAIAAALAETGSFVERVPADRRMGRLLEDGGFDFVFNLAEGEGRRCREAVPAAVCELLGLPFTGPDALTLALTLDKALARRALALDVPSAPAVLWEAERADDPDLAADLSRLAYPAIVKPNDEGSSKGIDAGSLAAGPREAEARCRLLHARYGCPALVEEFLPGAEVTVGIVGNGREARILGMMEIAPCDDAAPFLYSVEVKRDYRRRVRYHVPPRLPAATLEEIARLGLAAYRVLGCRDAARIDFRMDAAGQPHFLECNALPGLDPEHSDLVILSRGIMMHGDLVRGILADASKRFALALPCVS
jgi:D-alanine-D-alanine ligase